MENNDVTIRIKDIVKEVKAIIKSNDEKKSILANNYCVESTVCQVSGKDLP
jgi:hypothetical protein|tara:strand:- start:337 stop:489 length:153 start_codon:yes stop_codon:yes gene_type:complete